MSNGGVNFNAPIHGGANVNAGDGQLANGSIHNVQGDQINAGVVSQGDNATIDASGQVVSFSDTPDRPHAGFFDAIRSQLEEEDQTKTEDNFSLLDVPTFPPDIMSLAKENAPQLPTPSIAQISQFADLSGTELVSAWEEQAELPEEDQDLGKVASILYNIKKFAPKVGYGIVAAGEAYLKSKVQSSSIVSAGIAFLGELRG